MCADSGFEEHSNVPKTRSENANDIQNGGPNGIGTVVTGQSLDPFAFELAGEALVAA